MFNPQADLLITILTGVVPTSDFGASPAASWNEAKSALNACNVTEVDLVEAVDKQDPAALTAILNQWHSGKRYLIEHDREILKQAMKAFRKRLKATLLDAESTLGGGAMTGGRVSNIVGIRPHERFPKPVWEELVRQKRLNASRNGTYELGPNDIH